MNLNLDNVHKIVCLGIGGGDVSYISKFLFYLGIEVEGFDIAVNERVKELKKLGIKIHYGNPERKLPKSDLVIYLMHSNNLLQELKKENKNVKFMEVGKLRDF
jgi:UDP-N-acetylmuramate-alanine ligase